MKYPWQLSGGHAATRIAIARALGFEPKPLMMDEPLRSPGCRSRATTSPAATAREQRTVVFVTARSPGSGVPVDPRIVVEMSLRLGRIVGVIDSPLPAERTLALRDTPAFMALAHDVRALAGGHH